MPQYNFNRRTEALRRSLLRGRQTGLAFEAPAVFSTKASDGTVIPIPLELLADEATIVVSQPDQCRPGDRSEGLREGAATVRRCHPRIRLQAGTEVPGVHSR